MLGQGATRVRCLLLAAAFVLLLFADVLFRGGSLSPLDYDLVLASGEPPPRPVSLLPERAGRQIGDGFGDVGNALYQMQPAQKFLAQTLRSSESPYWDPYSATGMMGPETLVDVKFSVVNLVSALLGARSSHFTFILLGLYLCGLYALVRLLTTYLLVSTLAAIGACAAFMLNGFALMNLHTPLGQPYFLAPVVLLSLLALSARITLPRVVLCVLAHVALFSVTMFPTMVLVAITVHGIALAHALGGDHSARKWPRIVLSHVTIPIVAVLALGFLYFPIFEAYSRYVDTWSTYNRRVIEAVSSANFLSIFTPKHFWQSYLAMDIPPTWPALKYERWVPHLGVIACLMAAHTVGKAKRSRLVALVCLAFVVISEGKAFGLFPFTYLSQVPFFSFVRNEYWPAMTCTSLVVLVALGFESLRNGDAFKPVLAPLLTAGMMLGSFLVLLYKIGVPRHRLARPYIAVFLFILVGSLACLVLARRKAYRKLGLSCLAVGIFAEGLFYMNTLHPLRSDRDERLAASFAWLKSRLPGPAGDRVLNIGTTGLFPEWGSALQIPQVGTMNLGESPRYREFFSRYIGSGIFLTLDHSDVGHRFDKDSLSLLGVRYIIADRGLPAAIARLEGLGYPKVQEDPVRFIFENPDPLPRAFAAPLLLKSERLPHEHSLSPLVAATTVDARLLGQAQRLGIQDHSPIVDQHGTEPAKRGAGAASVLAYHHNEVRLHASLKVPAVLVLMDSWHPNWRAIVDREEAYVGRVNLAFRGIALPAGEHEIRFFYRPKTLRAGQAISALTLVTLLGLLITRRIGALAQALP